MLTRSPFSFTSGLVTLLTLGCASDNEISVQRKELRTDEYTYDVGVIAVGERETIAVTLQSVAPGNVKVSSITSSDPDHFVILPSWADVDSDDDGVADELMMQRGSESDPTQEIVEVNFRPDEEGLFRAQLTILSDDSTTKERTEDDLGIIRVAIRGVGRTPCADVYPKILDYGKRPAGGYFSENLTIRNCGVAPLTISSFQVDGASSFYGASATPIYIYEEESTDAEVAWIPSSANPESASLRVTINDPDFPEGIELIGNSCQDSKHEDWDVDEDGWRSCAGDCDDNDANINPSMAEVSNNRDDNCNGDIDEEQDTSLDVDGDGYALDSGDCAEGNPDVSPDGIEVINGIDDDCDGIIDNNTERFDDDEDGLTELEGDCDDTTPEIHPSREELDNGVDDNCNGFVDEGFDSFDDDRDGYSEADGDCDDNNPWVWPSNIEDCDGIDNDCDGEIDEVEEGQNDGCSFVVEREETLVDVVPDSGCSSAAASSSLWITLLGLVLPWSRRQRVD